MQGIIEKIKDNEINTIMEIWYTETLKVHSFIDEAYWKKVYDISRREYLPIAETYTYKIENKIIGFVSIIGDEFVGAIFIEESYQRRGLGSEMLNFLKAKKDRLILNVYEKNVKALKFYEKNNFITINIKENIEASEKEHVMLWRS